MIQSSLEYPYMGENVSPSLGHQLGLKAQGPNTAESLNNESKSTLDLQPFLFQMSEIEMVLKKYKSSQAGLGQNHQHIQQRMVVPQYQDRYGDSSKQSYKVNNSGLVRSHWGTSSQSQAPVTFTSSIWNTQKDDVHGGVKGISVAPTGFYNGDKKFDLFNNGAQNGINKLGEGNNDNSNLNGGYGMKSNGIWNV